MFFFSLVPSGCLSNMHFSRYSVRNHSDTSVCVCVCVCVCLRMCTHVWKPPAECLILSLYRTKTEKQPTELISITLCPDCDFQVCGLAAVVTSCKITTSTMWLKTKRIMFICPLLVWSASYWCILPAQWQVTGVICLLPVRSALVRCDLPVTSAMPRTGVICLLLMQSACPVTGDRCDLPVTSAICLGQVWSACY